MKGFPNQVADLTVLTRALRVLRDLADQSANPRDDGVYGEALLRQQVLRTDRVLPQSELEFPFAGVSITTEGEPSHEFRSERLIAA